MIETKNKEMVSVINLYFTPLAVFLVCLSIIFSEPMGPALYVPIILLGVALINNLVTVGFSDRNKWVIWVRQIVNIVINIFIVYLLVGFWEPIWYLFLLTPLATAVYGSRLKTFLTGIVMSSLLIGIYALRGVSGAVAWGQAGSKAVLIIVLSLFVNALTTICYRK
jgi:hypothetical protein